MENQARPYIYTNTLDEKVDDATGETHMFTASELKQRETMDFDYLFQGVTGSTVWDSYTLSGAVVTNFFNKVGSAGMQELFATLKDLNSAQLLVQQDSDSDVAALVRPSTDQSTDDAVVDLIKNKIHKYISDTGSFSPNIPPVASTNASPAPQKLPSSAGGSTASCVRIARGLSKGMRGDDVRAFQLYLIASGYLAPGLSSGYYGALTLKAVQAWQSAHGISPLGNVGPKTRGALSAGCNA